jgi:hypothetical protein
MKPYVSIKIMAKSDWPPTVVSEFNAAVIREQRSPQEDVRGMHRAGFAELLRAKRPGEEDDFMDFGDYLGMHYSDRTFVNPLT